MSQIMLGNNLKVHFAGLDAGLQFFISLEVSDVHYSLFSCYPYIVNKKLDGNLVTNNNFIHNCDQHFKHLIMDSGLFTLMFGAKKGSKLDLNFLINWQDKIIKFVNQNQIKATCVELDCQKVLGTDEAWYLRKRMKDKLPNRQINVFHLEDGMKGLDRLIEFSDYIAFSVPELRIHRPKSYREGTRELVNYTKNKKPKIDIHLLGCTEFGMLKENKCCTSSDSTSWESAGRYGRLPIKGSPSIKSIRPDILEYFRDNVKKACRKHNAEYSDKAVTYMARNAISAILCKKEYEKNAGSQI